MVEQNEADAVADRLSKQVTTAAAAFAAIATVAGTFAAATGDLERMFRNLFWLSITAAALIGIAAILGFAIAPLRHGKSAMARAWRDRWTSYATALLVLGLIVAAVAGAKSTSIIDQPSITGSITANRGINLDTSITAAGLRSGDIVHISIDGFMNEEQVATTPNKEQNPTVLYRSDAGASRAGLVNVKLEIPVEPGTYSQIIVSAWTGKDHPDCNKVANSSSGNAGCLLVNLPKQQSRPQLAMAWKGNTPSSRRLEVRLREQNVRLSGGVALLVMGKSKTWKALHEMYLVPDGNGQVDQTISVPLQATKATDICIIADSSTTRISSKSCRTANTSTSSHAAVPTGFIK